MRRPPERPKRPGGFTLIEMVTSIIILGIVGATMAVFLRAPLTGYFDVTRRAEMLDISDVALRRMARDLRTALPNSVRVTNVGANWYLEYLEVRTSGRYVTGVLAPAPGVSCPAVAGDPGNDNLLQFTFLDGCFYTLGATPNRAQIVNNSDFVVVFNQGPGFANSDAYFGGNATVAGGNKSQILGTVAVAGPPAMDRFTITPLAFTLNSPSNRFHVISGPVSYECNPATGLLRRFSGYPIAAAQPTAFAGATVARVASGISACSFTYDNNALAQRVGIVSIYLQLTQTDANTNSPERAELFSQVQVSNSP